MAAAVAIWRAPLGFELSVVAEVVAGAADWYGGLAPSAAPDQGTSRRGQTGPREPLQPVLAEEVVASGLGTALVDMVVPAAQWERLAKMDRPQ